MVTKQILEYIKTQQAQKTSNDEIETELRKSGWTQKDIDDAFVIVAGGKPTAEAPKTKSNQKTCLIIGAVAGCGCLALVVVFSIFGAAILVAINPAAQMEKVQEVKAKSDRAMLFTSLFKYYTEHEAFPELLTDLVPNYIEAVPVIPFTEEEYEYTRSKDGSNYSLCGIFTINADRKCLTADSESEVFPQLTPLP